MKNIGITPPGEGEVNNDALGASVDEALFDFNCNNGYKDERHNWLLDDETGFPLSIFPYADAPSVYTKNGTLYHKDPDDHHLFFPRKLFLSNEIAPGGQIVRMSRVQQVRRHYHDLAHKSMSPPPLIGDPIEQFNMSMLALSNFVPRGAIELEGEGPAVRNLSQDEYSRLCEATRIDFSRSYGSQVGRFFIDIMLNNHIDCLDDRVVCDFLEARYSRVKRDLGQRILKTMSSAAVEPINNVVAELKKDGEIPLGQPTPYSTIRTYTKNVKGTEAILQAHLARAA